MPAKAAVVMARAHDPAVKAASERIRLRLARTAEDIIAIGRDLAEVKKKLPHGSWVPWLEAEFGMSQDWAGRAMQVAGKYPNSEPVRNLGAKALFLLAADNTPEEVRDEVTARVEAGERVTAAEVKRLKDEAAAAKSAAKDADKKRKQEKLARQIAEREAGEADAEKQRLRQRVQDLEWELEEKKSEAVLRAAESVDEAAASIFELARRQDAPGAVPASDDAPFTYSELANAEPAEEAAIDWPKRVRALWHMQPAALRQWWCEALGGDVTAWEELRRLVAAGPQLPAQAFGDQLAEAPRDSKEA